MPPVVLAWKLLQRQEDGKQSKVAEPRDFELEGFVRVFLLASFRIACRVYVDT
jgi:hypothetical protein